MNSFILDRKRFGVIAAAFALLIATVLAPLAMAAQVTERSIEATSSARGATGVTYKVKFKAGQDNTGAFAIDFCTTPTIGAACATPADFSIPSSGFSVTGDGTGSRVDANTVKVELTAAADEGEEVEVDLVGVTNPTVTGAGLYYARIVTYVDGSTNYFYNGADDLDEGGEHLDDGTVAMVVNDSFSVSGAVLESLIFCIARSTDMIGTGCSGTLNTPNLALGTDGVLATTPSEASVKTQLSTNAASGAVVNLKSSAVGGGLIRAGAATSEITPLNTLDTGDVPFTALANNSAKFGMKLANLGSGISALGNYSTSGYYLDYVAGNLTGITSVYGSPIFSSGTVVNDGTADLTFAATSSNTTPAGNYSTSINLIATGKF
jgi:hypothetical protein